MKKIIEVKRDGTTPSRIVIGDVLAELDSYLPKESRVVVITDSNIHRHYTSLIGRYDFCLIGLGETIKTLSTVDRLYAELVERNADRTTFLLGIGGGIVTDVTGFVASTYMRGIRFGFVATSLLAQVDASVGGKNGVNYEGYKNMVGTFNQPEFVLCDSSVLATLSDREFRAGLSEALKAGLIADPELFGLFETHDYEQFRTDGALLAETVERAVRVKASIVERDERESGERRKLNLGHTFAHAIEKCTNNRLLHGEAVGVGTAMIARLSQQMGLLSAEDDQRVHSVIERMGLPLTPEVDYRHLLKALKHDKKKVNDTVNFVLMRGVGDCVIRNLSFAEIDALPNPLE